MVGGSCGSCGFLWVFFLGVLVLCHCMGNDVACTTHDVRNFRNNWIHNAMKCYYAMKCLSTTIFCVETDVCQFKIVKTSSPLATNPPPHPFTSDVVYSFSNSFDSVGGIFKWSFSQWLSKYQIKPRNIFFFWSLEINQEKEKCKINKANGNQANKQLKKIKQVFNTVNNSIIIPNIFTRCFMNICWIF